jgi:transporter family protein
MNPLVWLMPTVAALLLYGLGQGFVKKWISEVPPARFCLYFVVAKVIFNLGYFFTQSHSPPFSHGISRLYMIGILAYVMDGAGWILYFQSIVAGPITIVGTLSAAYPALVIVFARIFLNETLHHMQYLGVILVIGGCIGLSYAPPDPNAKVTKKRWIPFAAAALLLWGIDQTMVKWCYNNGASDPNMALYNTIGAAASLGVYGVLRGRQGTHSSREWVKSFVPMGMMAGGDLAVIIASQKGPISLVNPISGAYPVITLLFGALVLREKVTKFQYIEVVLIVIGLFLCAAS